MRAAAAAALLLGFSAPALAEKACFISYEGFEEKTPHLDLDTCPGAQIKPEEGFCRIRLDGDAVFIYTFRHMDPEPCLERVDRYAFNEFVGRFGPTYDKP